MRNARLWFALILFVAVFVFASNSQAISFQDEKGSLKNLKEINVNVIVDDELVKAGVDRNDIQTAAELKLRMAGIKVPTEKEVPKTPWIAFLFVELSGLKITGTGMFALVVSVKLKQDVYLARDTTIALFTDTWTDSRIGYVGIFRMSDIQYLINPSVDEFINDYLSVNPKK